ncbi:MAG: carbamoyl-phosphate synthase large subunit, partial [Pseudomonadota bacterium]
EESVLGWKEFEMEVVRDRSDNCIIICAIENVDPMGVHTGDSITVAPALTLTDKEYQIMRDASIAVLRAIGVDTGGSNVQFAVNPENGRLVVIEMNPRVSRSSALASKATGFPIAKVAAKLAIGYTLDELSNDITGVTPASFEPTIDYVVTKMPRFTFEKFPGAEKLLTTSMKSVGEAMSIGRCFSESVQKALRSMETGLTGFDPVEVDGVVADGDPEANKAALTIALGKATPDRLLVIAEALRHGLTREEVRAASKFDPWFIDQISHVVEAEETLRMAGFDGLPPLLGAAKRLGFSDERIAALIGKHARDIRQLREASGVEPVFKRIDTCAGEFASQTPYMYSTYEKSVDGLAGCESDPTNREKIVILGGGPNRIGQGIEFDYCCVHAAYALSDAGFETIMVNCNPETVSTDYDTSDRLYFEPLTIEDVIALIRKEQTVGSVKGVIVQLGGQTPLKLAAELDAAGIPILGTPYDAIDLAEDRERFQKLLQQQGLRQPANGIATSGEQAEAVAGEIGFPVVIRPSYVLGGRAMEIVHDLGSLRRYIANAVQVSGSSPVLIDRYLQDAIEVDVDAVRDSAGGVYVAGIMEHIEEAGIHSGDSACALPPYSLSTALVKEIAEQTRKLADALGVVGLMNVQFALKGEEIYVLEVNPRASRTVPFVAKAIGLPLAKIASRIMAGETLDSFGLEPGYEPERSSKHVAVKEAVFPFARFPGVDTILGPEMRSTGEVMGIDAAFGHAFAKAQMGAGVHLPRAGKVFISVRDRDKPAMLPIAKQLVDLGFEIVATRGTGGLLQKEGVPVHIVNKVLEGRPHIVDIMMDGGIALVFNTTDGAQAIADSFSLRRTAISQSVPYYTTVAGARACVHAISALLSDDLEVASLQSYFH